MSKEKPSNYFSHHAKSSAALVSLAIHGLLAIVAVTFVAVTVITKEEQKFEAPSVNRPKMQLKKLQVPVDIKKKKMKQPKLRKRIVVNPKLNQNMPDIKMPEITGIKGGVGAAGGGGLGKGGGIGFSLPEVELFGVRSKGEKIFLILDSSPQMMYDEMGGIPAYSIIKDELIRIVDSLGPATLFNVVVFEGRYTRILFPAMVSANSANAGKVKEWLTPLNAVSPGMSSRDYGVGTLGIGGMTRDDDLRVGKFAQGVHNWQERWYRPAMIAMQQQADTVYILTEDWGLQRYAKQDYDNEWHKTSDGRRWTSCFEKGKEKLEEENKRRAKQGMAPKVIAMHPHAINGEYFPDIVKPPEPEYYYYTPADFLEGFLEVRGKNKTGQVPGGSGISKSTKRMKKEFSLNVIQFVKEGEGPSERSESNFKKLTSMCNGDYKTVAGLEAIQGYAVGSAN